MSIVDSAIELAMRGLPVFPLAQRSKLPAVKRYAKVATTDPTKIKEWWSRNPEYNIGISTERLLALDVDNKGKKKGDEELVKLERSGQALPPTFEQRTPTGGRHFLFQVPEPVKQGVNVLGPGLDIRGRGGYVVGAGSVLECGVYTATPRPLRAAPEWLVARVGKAVPREHGHLTVVDGIEPSRAAHRASEYLIKEAPLAKEGESGDQTTFQVACRVKDCGVDSLTAFELMADIWNDRCLPPWELGTLAKKVENAYAYGREPVGVAAPEAEFEPIEDEEKEHPFDVLNREYAYVISGGKDFILHETVDAAGKVRLEHWDIDAFHRRLLPFKMVFNDKSHPVSKLWISDSRRRTYDGIVFSPGKETPERFYNLWRGFTVEPAQTGSEEAESAVDAWFSHLHENVCGGDSQLTHWLTGYFAHIVQRPWEKPLVALVMKGGKGVGKNALIERVGYLLGEHFAVISNRRHLTGNFNSVLENKILLTLDEAFWSGDKAAEGVIKDMITGEHHLIERKGKEPYRIANCLRVVILGNEDWLAPATGDERRFAVFNVGDAKKQNREFFKKMRTGMEAGGYGILLRHLQEFPLSQVDVSEAPSTIGLHEQKIQSLPPFLQWWRDSLGQGRLVGSDFGGEWPRFVSKVAFREALYREMNSRNMRVWQPSFETISKELKRICPSVECIQKRNGQERFQAYAIPTLLRARKDWDAFIGHETAWEQDGDDEDLFS